MFEPKNITKSHIVKAVSRIESEGVVLKPSTIWNVIINEKTYPPKDILRYAHEEMNGHFKWEYTGGETTNKYLKKLGYIIKKKEMNPILDLIQRYKIHIKNTELKDEVYKWEIVNTYKGRPNTDASDFTEELKSIKFQNLLYHNSIGVINHLAKEFPVELSKDFKFLLNEAEPIQIRLNTFAAQTLKLYRKLEETLGTHQDERSMATYLTLHNPDKYTFYKSSFYKKYCKLIEVNSAKAGQKYIHYLELINDLVENYIKKDTELIALVKTYIPEQYNGENHMLLAQDILYQMLDKQSDDPTEKLTQPNKSDRHYWIYAPGEKARLWDEFYDEGIMGLGWDELGDLNNYDSKEEIVSKLQELENTTGSKKNDATANFDFKQGIQIGDVIIPKKGKDKYLGYGIVTSEYYYDNNRAEYRKCRKVDWIKNDIWIEPKGNIVLKTLTDITEYTDYVESLNKLIGIEMKETIIKLEINSNKPVNQILYGPPGTGKTYITKKMAVEIIDGNAPENREELSKRYEELVTSKQIQFTTFHQSMSYEDFVEGIKPKTEDNKVTYDIEDGIFKEMALKASAKKSSNFEEAYDDLIKALQNLQEDYIVLKTKTGKEFRVNVNSNGNLNLFTTKNINKQGVFTKNKLGSHFNGNQEFNGWEGYAEGVLNYLKKEFNLGHTKEDNQRKKYVLIIDEINRGNISAIFGELITLLENDKRAGNKEALQILLPYSKKPFSVPNNLHIIGTMNTADRSVEALDTALRRRFSFVEMMPKPELLKDIVIEEIVLSELLKTINERIEILIDRDHTIGHAYFINVSNKEKLKETFKNNIIPLLQEYFFGDYGKIGLVLGEGFVELVQPKTNVFADLKNYDGAQDYNQTTFKLIAINDDFNIIEAIQLLMPKTEAEA